MQCETLLFVGIARAWTGPVEAAHPVFDALIAAARDAEHHRLAEEAEACAAAVAEGSLPWFRGGTPPK